MTLPEAIGKRDEAFSTYEKLLDTKCSGIILGLAWLHYCDARDIVVTLKSKNRWNRLQEV